MAEQITFPAPIEPALPVVYRVSEIVLDDFNNYVRVTLREWDGSVFGPRTKECAVIGVEAQNLMITLNKANLTIKSLHKRALEWALAKLQAEGRAVSGTISGVVD